MTTRLYTPRQIVALNLARARRLRGLTQAEAADLVDRCGGRRWSQVSWSMLECSIDDGHRSCHFDINDLVALAQAFEVPIGWFLTPPGEADARFAAPGDDSENGVDFGILLDIVFGLDEGIQEWLELLATAASVREPNAELTELATARVAAAVRLTFGDVRAACQVIDNLIWWLHALDEEVGCAADDPARLSGPQSAIAGEDNDAEISPSVESASR